MEVVAALHCSPRVDYWKFNASLSHPDANKLLPAPSFAVKSYEIGTRVTYLFKMLMYADKDLHALEKSIFIVNIFYSRTPRSYFYIFFGLNFFI